MTRWDIRLNLVENYRSTFLSSAPTVGTVPVLAFQLSDLLQLPAGRPDLLTDIDLALNDGPANHIQRLRSLMGRARHTRGVCTFPCPRRLRQSVRGAYYQNLTARRVLVTVPANPATERRQRSGKVRTQAGRGSGRFKGNRGARVEDDFRVRRCPQGDDQRAIPRRYWDRAGSLRERARLPCPTLSPMTGRWFLLVDATVGRFWAVVARV
jgi:hypothetical protein